MKRSSLEPTVLRRSGVTFLILLLLASGFVAPGSAEHTGAPSTRTYTAETLFDARWDTGAVKAEYTTRPAWQEPLTGRGVRVGIIDTGVDPDHPDLGGTVVAWRDFIERRPTPYDDDTHGTHVAGIIAARGHLQPDPLGHYFPLGARGIAPDAELIVAKAMDRKGDGDAGHVADAIYWMLDPDGDGDYDDGAEIINLSIGIELPPEGDDGVRGPVTLPVLQGRESEDLSMIRAAIGHAVAAGAVVVVAAGNHEPGAASDTVTFPGVMDEVITVGATDRDGTIAAFSNAGTPGSLKPDLVAPGVLLSTFPLAQDTQDGRRDGYLALGGTSMAAPLVAGTIALILEGDPSLRGLDPAGGLDDRSRRIKALLTTTTEPAEGSTGHDLQYGHGRLRVDAALAAAAPVDGGLDAARLLTVLALVALLALGVVVRRRDRHRKAALRRIRAELAARAAAGRDLPAGAVPASAAAAAGDPAGEDPAATGDDAWRAVREDPARFAWMDVPLDDDAWSTTDPAKADAERGMLVFEGPEEDAAGGADEADGSAGPSAPSPPPGEGTTRRHGRVARRKDR